VTNRGENNNDSFGISGKQKLERIKNYGRWYLKAEEFQRIINNKKEQDKDQEMDLESNDMKISHKRHASAAK